MFLLASVILSTGGVGRCMISLHVWLPGPIFLWGGGGGGLCMMSLPVWLPSPMFLQGGSLSLVPCSRTETPLTETPWTETPIPWIETPLDRDYPCTVKSGQYTSYWNAFLLILVLKISVGFSETGTKIYGSSSAPLSPHCLSDHGSES